MMSIKSTLKTLCTSQSPQLVISMLGNILLEVSKQSQANEDLIIELLQHYENIKQELTNENNS